jgi:hypothetical protein
MLKTAYAAYFDASGNRQQPALTVLGFVSEVGRWKEFEFAWKKILRAESLTYFHMTDFVARKPPFDKWPDDESGKARRDRFFRSLLGAVTGKTERGFSVMLPIQEYESANRVYQIDEWFGGPYPFAGLGCAIKLKKWADAKQVQHLQVFFESGDEGQGALCKRLETLLGMTPVFKPKEELIPFQAADLAAWEGSKLIKTAQSKLGDYIGIRKSFLALDAGPKDWGSVLREDIIQTCRNYRVPRR